jgi:hypothetical protein
VIFKPVNRSFEIEKVADNFLVAAHNKLAVAARIACHGFQELRVIGVTNNSGNSGSLPIFIEPKRDRLGGSDFPLLDAETSGGASNPHNLPSRSLKARSLNT